MLFRSIELCELPPPPLTDLTTPVTAVIVFANVLTDYFDHCRLMTDLKTQALQSLCVFDPSFSMRLNESLGVSYL